MSRGHTARPRMPSAEPSRPDGACEARNPERVTDPLSERAAPGGEPPVNVQVPAKVTAERPEATVALRRRREAAQRMPPLPDGSRDPLDSLAGRQSAKRLER